MIGTTGQYSDNLLSCGIKGFMQVADKTLQRFESRKGVSHDITVAGIITISV